MNGQSAFKKLKGARSGFLSSSCIYHDDRQIVVVDTGLLSERYRKIAYADICGFSISQSKRPVAIGSILAALLALFAIIAITNSFQTPAWWILSLFFAILFAYNLYKGKGSKCQLTTAYSVIPLKPLDREKAARRFKALLDEKIVPVQGTLTPEEIANHEARRDAETRAPAQAAVESPPTVAPPTEPEPSLGQTDIDAPPEPAPSRLPSFSPPPIPIGNLPGRRHYIFPWAAISLALLCSFRLLIPAIPLIVLVLVYVAAMIGATVTLSRKVDTLGGNTLASVAKWAVAFYIAQVIVGYISWISMFAFSRKADPTAMYTTGLDAMAAGNAAFFQVVFIVNLVVNAIFAIVYASALRKSRPIRTA